MIRPREQTIGHIKVSKDNFEVLIPRRDGSCGNGTIKEEVKKEATYSLVNNIGAMNKDYKDIRLDNITDFDFGSFSKEYKITGAHVRYAKANDLSLFAILKASIESIVVKRRN